jgi:cyclohexanecarboxyl-CoA dehydrogenase
LGSIALTEPEEGSDFMALQSLAVKDGNRYVISGEKCPVSFGMQADFTILFAKTPNETGGSGVTAFLVPLGLPHINKSPIDTTGLLSSYPVSIAFDDVSVPVCNRLGNEGEGLGINRAFGLFSDLGRILSGLAALGVSQSALRSAIDYSRERHAFGRPIGQFQAVSEKIAEAATLVEAGRWLCYRALWLKDQNAPNTKEAAMSASWCASTAYQIIEETLLIHGHTGYSDDHPFQQMLRDVLAFQLIPGTRQTLKLLIAQEVLGSIGVPKEMAGAVE